MYWYGTTTLAGKQLQYTLDPARVRFVPHHLAHAASAYLAAPYRSSAVLVLDGRGERASCLTGHAVEGRFQVLSVQEPQGAVEEDDGDYGTLPSLRAHSRFRSSRWGG